jgi:hypothetical protein
MALPCRGANCSAPPTGIVGWWPAEGNANDISGADPGVLQGGATAGATGMVGSAFSFDGTNGFVQIPDSPAFHLATLTVEAWVKFDSLNSAGTGAAQGEQFIVFKQNSRSSEFEGFYLGKTRISNQDRLTFQVTSVDGQNVEIDSTTVVTTGVWYHVVGVRGTNSLLLYVNGLLQSQASVSFAQDYRSLPLYFGTSGQPSWDRKLRGELDEISLYNRPLGSNEVAAIYAAGAAGKCQAPRITAQPQSQSVAAGATATLTVLATGGVPLFYQWWKNEQNLADDGNIFGSATSSLTVSNFQASDAADYQVVITNYLGSVTSAVASLALAGVPEPPTISTQPTNQTVYSGANVSFTVSATGSEPLSYQWRINDANITDGGQFFGAGTAGLSVSNAQPGNSGGYSVMVSNSAGVVTSSVAALTVNPANGCAVPPAGLIGWWPGYGNGRDIIGTNNAILEGGAIDGAPGEVGTAFNFDGTNGYAQIPNAPELNQSNVTVECWVRFDRLDSDGTNPQGNAYLVFKQNTRNSVFEGINLAKHRVTGGDIIVWEVSSAAGQPVQINSVTFVTTNVWYHVAGLRGSNYTQLYINGQLEAEGSVDFPQDYGNYPLYFGTSGQPSWDRRLAGSLDEVSLYNRALSGSEIAEIYAAGAAGKCQSPPAILAQPTGGIFYLGSSITLTSAVSGTPPLGCQWLKDGALVPGATATSLTLTNLQTTNAGSYVLVVTNLIGSVASAAAIVQLKVADVSVAASGLPSSTFGLGIAGVVGRTYGIQCSTDLGSGQWQGLTNLTLNSPSQIWNDPQPMILPQRFYRVVFGPVSIP